MTEIEITALVPDMIVRVELNGTQDVTVETRDTLTGQSAKTAVTLAQAGAILALLVAGDDAFNEEVTRSLYDLAEVALTGWPTNLRPIP